MKTEAVCGLPTKLRPCLFEVTWKACHLAWSSHFYFDNPWILTPKPSGCSSSALPHVSNISRGLLPYFWCLSILCFEVNVFPNQVFMCFYSCIDSNLDSMRFWKETVEPAKLHYMYNTAAAKWNKLDIQTLFSEQTSMVSSITIFKVQTSFKSAWDFFRQSENVRQSLSVSLFISDICKQRKLLQGGPVLQRELP